MEVRIIFLASHDGPVAVVAALVGAVVAGLAKNHAVFEQVGSAEFGVPHMMRMGDFTEGMLRAPCFSELRDARPA